MRTAIPIAVGDNLRGYRLVGTVPEMFEAHGPSGTPLELEPGGRMQSMMAPSLALDDRGLVLAIGAAGGTRLRTALLTVAAAILDEGVEPQQAVDEPRAHPAGLLVNAEPGTDEDALTPPK